MFQFRSIRRMLVAGILVGLTLLLALAVISVLALRSYQEAVNSFDYAVNSAPQRAALSVAFARILNRLQGEPNNRSAEDAQQEVLLERIRDARGEVNDFLRRVDDVIPVRAGVLRPAFLPRRRAIERSLQRLNGGLSRLEFDLGERDNSFVEPVSSSILLARLRSLATVATPDDDEAEQRRAMIDSIVNTLADNDRDVDNMLSAERRSQILMTSLEATFGVDTTADRGVADVPPAESSDTPSTPSTATTAGTALSLATLRGELKRFWKYRYRQSLLQRMQSNVAAMIDIVDKLPVPYEVKVPVEPARSYHKSLQRTVYFITSVALVLTIGLIWLAVYGVYRPMRDVRDVVEGACRVAQGDYDYRLKLNSDLELSQLAQSFNKMTDRFKDKEQDLQEQVEVRSRQLVRSERLAGVGFLAAGVAHEINNPLQAIRLASDSLMFRLDDLLEGRSEDDVKQTSDYLSMIQSEAARCREITSRLLDFARGEKSARAPTDLSQIIEEVLNVVSHMSRFRDRTIDFASERSVEVEAHASQIKQVVLNLIANALEATDAGGRLEIRLIERTDDVIIEFRDNGCGMSPEIIGEVFEPFATHRRDGKGTGLGLCISERIVREHNGTLEAHSEGPGRGSVFRLRLPRQTAQSSAA